jgi:hypothetical protein
MAIHRIDRLFLTPLYLLAFDALELPDVEHPSPNSPAKWLIMFLDF